MLYDDVSIEEERRKFKEDMKFRRRFEDQAIAGERGQIDEVGSDARGVVPCSQICIAQIRMSMVNMNRRDREFTRRKVVERETVLAEDAEVVFEAYIRDVELHLEKSGKYNPDMLWCVPSKLPLVRLVTN